jgi:pyruvate-formate lyase-activating enzyme
MKAKLIFPPAFDEADSFTPPHGICVLAGHLRAAGLDVATEDLMVKLRSANHPRRTGPFRRPFDLELARDRRVVSRHLFEDEPNPGLRDLATRMARLGDLDGCSLVGISVQSILQLPFALLLAREIKERHNPLVVLGGTYVTLAGEGLLGRATFIDLMIRGDGEVPLQALLEAEGRLEAVDVGSVPGLIHRRGDNVVANSPDFFPAERMAPPDLGGLDLDLYRTTAGRIILPYSFSKGCDGHCSFCTHHTLSGRPQVKSARKVVRELRQLRDACGARHFQICDSLVNVDLAGQREILDALAEEDLGIQWGAMTRPHGISRELARSLRRAGCRFLLFGFESGSDRMLRKIGKRHTARTALEAARNVDEEGIEVVGSFIAGFPGETRDDVRQTTRFIERISRHAAVLGCGVCGLEPGSLLEKLPHRYGVTNLQLQDKPTFDSTRTTYRFDEIDGLPWERKQRQQRASRRAILRAIHRHVVRRRSRSLLQRLLPHALHQLAATHRFDGGLLSFLYSLVDRDYYPYYCSRLFRD